MDVFTAFDAERIEADRAKGHAFWLDLDNPPEGEIERVGEMLGLHPLAIEDTREFGQRPKVDVYDDHVLLVFYTARPGRERLRQADRGAHLHRSGVRADRPA